MPEQKKHASKEECRKAQVAFTVIWEAVRAHDPNGGRALLNEKKAIDDFFTAAERKLPTEAAFQKDEHREAGGEG